MSRIGQKPIPLPPGVRVQIEDQRLRVTGPKGELSRALPEGVHLELKGDTLLVTRDSDARQNRARHGLARTLAANLVEGVTRGYTKVLEIYGVGYRAQLQGARLNLQLGFSHPVVFEAPAAIAFSLETFVPTQENNYFSCRLTISGPDKELVGQLAANIRAARKPEPYKGKGIRYQGEHVRRKPGKAAQAAAAT
jgi:large subunit ribosomal protein L6